jgi:host factor-I protein
MLFACLPVGRRFAILGRRGGSFRMNKNQVNIQDQFLNRVRRDRLQVSLGLVTGQKMEGVILGFDNFSVMFRGDSDHLIYKHAISSISVREKLDLTEMK